MPHSFKFFIVEEVMSSSLFASKRLNLNSSEKGKVILFPLIQKFRKVSNFTQVSITQANKETICRSKTKRNKIDDCCSECDFVAAKADV